MVMEIFRTPRGARPGSSYARHPNIDTVEPTVARPMVFQRKRITNKPNKPNKSTNTNKNKRAANKFTVHVTNKQRIDSKLLNLTLDVNALQEETRALKLHRSLLYARTLLSQQDADGSVFKRAAHYFQVFGRGYRVTEAASQFAYVQAISDDALSMGTTGLGREMLFEQWRRYADYFAFRFLLSPRVRVITNDSDGSCIVRCDTQLHGTFTWQALAMVFPAALRDAQLAQQLIGREMVTPLCFHLHFNAAGRMVRHDFEADFLSALATALNDAGRAASIVQEAKLAEEAMVEAVPATVERYGDGVGGLRDNHRSAVPSSAQAKRVRAEEESAMPHSTRGDASRHKIEFLLS